MSGFQQLSFLVRVCNLTGLMPFGIKRDPKTKRITNFYFAYWHPFTWWCFATFIGQVVVMFLMASSLFKAIMNQSLHNQDFISMINLCVNVTNYIGFFLISVVPRYVSLRFMKIGMFFNSLNHVDKMTTHVPIKGKHAAWYTLGVLVFCCLYYPSAFSILYPLYDSMIEYDGYSRVHGLMGAYGFLMLQIYSIGAIYKLALYFIKNELKALLYLLERMDDYSYEKEGNSYIFLPRNESCKPTKSGGLSEEKFKGIKKAFFHLWETSNQLNKLFALPLLLFTTVKTISLICSFFQIACILANIIFPSSVLHEFNYLEFVPLLVTFLVDVAFISAIFNSVSSPLEKMDKLRKSLMEISNRDLKNDEMLQVLAFQVQASDDCINISACGYFKITKDVVPALLGTVLTYVILLMTSALQGTTVGANNGTTYS